MLLKALLLLSIAVLGLRGAAAVLRTPGTAWPVRLAGWALAGVAAWLAAGAAGAWAPLWPALLAGPAIGAAAGLVERRGGRVALRAAADAVLVAGLGLLAIPPLAPARTAAAALLLAAAGAALDLAAERLPALLARPARWAAGAAVAGVGLFVAYALLPPGDERRPSDMREAVALSSGVMPATMPGERRITLDTGAVAWFDRPRGDGPFPGALFFHGAHSWGSYQPAALAARRALLDAGFAVLAVDHPGYGASPHPDLGADVAAWDPLPTDLAAYETLAAMPGIGGITAVGHSMGNLDVLRLLGAGVPLDAAVMMGAALSSPETNAEYWDQRFLGDRGIAGPVNGFPVREVRRRYYDPGRYVAELPASHAPIRFVTFDVEWHNVASMRDEMYRLLPEPKAVWHMADATHYLSAAGRRGLVIGDTRPTRDLAAWLRNSVRGQKPS